MFFAAGSSVEGTVQVDATAATEGATVLKRANYANGRVDGAMLVTRKAYSALSRSVGSSKKLGAGGAGGGKQHERRQGKGFTAPWWVLLDVAKVLVGIKIIKSLPIDSGLRACL